MITSLKYYPILIASVVMMASFLFKILLVPDLKVTLQLSFPFNLSPFIFYSLLCGKSINKQSYKNT